MVSKKNFSTWVSLLSLTFLLLSFTRFPGVDLYKKLKNYSGSLPNEFNQITEERKKELKEIGDYILEQKASHKTTNLLFICTSNSRRSHMSQVWAQTAAVYYGIDSLWTFSGGTEATKVNIQAIEALRRCGFSITSSGAGENPYWSVSLSNKSENWVIFSKKYSHETNPKKNFAAIMVCSEADKSCPVVDGADARIPLQYDDPKYFDNTPSQDVKYDERCRQIARELFFTMNYVKEKLILKQESKK